MLPVLSNSALGFAVDIGEVKLTTVDNHLNNLQMSPATDEYRSQLIEHQVYLFETIDYHRFILKYSDSDLFPKFEFPSTLCSGLRFASLKLQKVGGGGTLEIIFQIYFIKNIKQ